MCNEPLSTSTSPVACGVTDSSSTVYYYSGVFYSGSHSCIQFLHTV